MIESEHGGDIYRSLGCMDFSANINPLGMPPAVLLAAWEGVTNSTQYPDVFCEELREGIGSYEGIEKETILCGNGAADIIYSFVLGFRPQKALLLAPTFSEYEHALETVDCEPIFYPLKESLDYELDIEYLKYLDDSIDVIFLCNPNNPTGQLISKDLLLEVLEQTKKHEIFTVMDECFLDMIHDGNHYSVKDLLKDRRDLLLIKAFTKLYAMPGLRLGYGITYNLELLHKMREATQAWNVSLPAQKAGVAALQEKKYVEETRTLIQRENHWLKSQLKELGLKVFDSKANYIFFKGPIDLYERMKHKGYLIRDCSNYRNLEKGSFRIAVKLPEDNQRLIQTLKDVLS
ncbi:MAG TPA: aminotransferase class I/II-fold pyridoxal phosphate-dependent enzyme [Candidatus Merdenecus merdavium]|nr:aminotransferase class I/II-fold pyridoxal phosphate-dependent enzyme [Candidatus Merdenecus merdavium]